MHILTNISLLIIAFRSALSDPQWMVIVFATPDPSSTAASETDVAWEDCVADCLAATTCQIAYRSGDGTKKCMMYDFEAVSKAPESTSAVGDRIAFKIDASDLDGTCPETAVELVKTSSSTAYTSMINDLLYRTWLEDGVYNFAKVPSF